MNYELELIHTDKFGNEWYGFKDVHKIPVIREYESQLIDLELRCGITRPKLLKVLEQCLQDMETSFARDRKEDKLGQVFTNLVLLKQNVELLTPKNAIMSLVKVFTILGDENPDTFDFEKQKQKEEIILSDEKAFAFFLDWCLKFIGSSTDNSEPIALKHLVESEMQRAMIFKELGIEPESFKENSSLNSEQSPNTQETRPSN